MSEQIKTTEILMIRIGELTLKKGNRAFFERRLIANIKERLASLGRFSVVNRHARIQVIPQEQDFDRKEAIRRLQTVFGIVSISPAHLLEGSFEDVLKLSARLISELIQPERQMTFKVNARRGDKRYKLTSPQINAQVGSFLLETFPGKLAVDLENPEIVLNVEVREQFYLYSSEYAGRRGLPVGTSGRGLLLLSGGIDSPVAGLMMASRGMQLEAVYFHAFPYTSDRAKDKVVRLSEILADYGGRIVLHVVNFTKLQVAIRDQVAEEMVTVITRRMMIRIAEKIALQRSLTTLITGDSLGQVASQTLAAITVIDQAAKIPVLRPLIGLDKEEIVTRSRSSGLYETSIEPYEDCCTIFVAKHPRTNPTPAEAQLAEKDFLYQPLVEEAMSDIEVIKL